MASRKNEIRNTLLFWRNVRIYFALPRQYSCLKATELISRSADSTDCTSIVTYMDIPACTSARVYVYTSAHVTTRVISYYNIYQGRRTIRWTAIRVFIKGACMCRFFDDTLDHEYILFHFHKNRWVSARRNHTVILDITNAYVFCFNMLKILCHHITCQTAYKDIIASKLMNLQIYRVF